MAFRSVVGRAACVMAHPGKMALFPFVHWFERRYANRFRSPRLMFSIDLVLIGLILGLLSTGLIFWFGKPVDIGDKIHFSAEVAPRAVVTGAPSTLIIRYANQTGEELRGARLTVGFPAHFELQELSSDLATPIGHNTFDLGTIPVNAEGSIKIRGVMFGDVGGTQTFRSILTFTHGEKNEAGQKVDFQTFSPARSTLVLALELPKRLIAGQTVSGTVTYHNTGAFDFPEIGLEPIWPPGFTLHNSSVPVRQNLVKLPELPSGASGAWTFNGTLSPTEDAINFEIQPSFVFGETRYRQDILVYQQLAVPPPVHVSHTVPANLLPGETADIQIAYQNTGTTAVVNAQIGVETDGPFFAKRLYVVDARTEPTLRHIEPGASGTITVRVPVRSTIQQSEISEDLASLHITTRAYASYHLEDDGQLVVSRGKDVVSPIITPLVLAANARYATPSGDQIGRGPLPPIVGEETRYWIFWTVRGTVNPLERVRIEGELPGNVRFTGRQTVSQGQPALYDSATRTVSWSAERIEPTLPAGSRVVGIAFEVALIPTTDQANHTAALIVDSSISAVDAITKAPLNAAAPALTTEMPNDPLASGQGLVQP